MANRQQATTLTPKEVEKLRYPLPESMKKAAGILRGQKINPLLYQKQIRQEWEYRLKKLEKLAQKISRPK